MTNFREAYRRLNDAQKKAVDAIEGPLLVIAGPGTGKTQLLSLRVANILKSTDASPENILCLTYTESGQRAMQSRLLEIIGESAKKIEVHTFHGFGTYLMHKYADHFPGLENFRAADDLALYEVLADSLAAISYDSPLTKRAYGQWIYLKDIAERISQCKQAGLTPTDVIARVKADLSWSTTTGSAITSRFQAAGRLSNKQLPQLINDLSHYLGTPVGESTLAATCLESLQVAVAESEVTDKTAALSTWKRQWLTSEDGKLYFKPTDQLTKLADFAEVYTLYEAGLKERELFDYDNMLLFALQGLRDNPALRATAQENFQYILADEYQDTNAAQASIIELIADNPVNEGRPNVMVVGDDDQAIYGFQGAMGQAMLAFRERWRDVQVITLTENYRSTQGLLDTARQVITSGTQRLENYYDDIDKQLNASQAGKAKPRRISTPSSESSLKHVANLIKTSSAQNLAIIASRHKYLSQLAAELDAQEVPYFYEGREDLLSDPIVSNILLVASASLAIQQDQPNRLNYTLPELITSDFTGLSKHEGWQLAVKAQVNQSGWWASLLASKDKACQHLVGLLKQIAKSLDPDNALAALRTVSEQLPHQEATDILEQKITALVDHATSYSQREILSLCELLAYVNRCRDAGIRLDTKFEAGKRGAATRLLSAHKSKGLEFDSVYVLHADEYTWFREKGRRNNLVLPPNWQHLQPATETFDDRLRVLYVVLTRARHELLLFTSQVRNSGQPTQVLPGTENISDEPAEVRDLAVTAPSPYQQHWHRWYWPVNLREQNELRSLLSQNLSRYRLSPSHLVSFLNVARGGPLSFLIHTLLQIPEPVSAEAVYGSRVHALLSYMQNHINQHGRVPSNKKLEAYATELLADDASPQVTKRLTQTVTRFQKTTKSLQKGSKAEYSFSEQQLKLNNIPVTGTLDRLDKTAAALSIVDYKTGRPFKSWQASDDYQRQKAHRFRQQLMFYELLCKQSPQLKAAKAIKSYIEFVEPAKRGGYYRLALEPTHQEQEKLISLIQAVWTSIMTLNLPDPSLYSPDMRGILQLEDELAERIADTGLKV